MADRKDPLEISGASRSGYDPGKWYWETRRKINYPAGTVLFTLLRVADLPLQWWLLRSSAIPDGIARLGGAPVPLAYTTTTTALGLSPYHSLILALATGSSLKQIYWKLFINDTSMPLNFSTIVCVYNTLLNTFNTALAFWSVTSQQPSDQSSLQSFFATAPLTLPVGIALYSVGIFVEWYCEVQRKAFKAKPENKGKPYSGGLFGLARNINYGGYTLWRTGYSLICGGWPWAVLMAAWLAGDFCARAIPSLDAYCEKRYGEQWEEVRRKVPYRLLPWVY
ncbi:hypothetical protein LTR36_006406 [Oleoguttula mirabilis]|uniref:Delta(14)-sterol reductase n=1 Tax=Oleoguttula mirabilis TaxID=1507867 RepID=A0AAV9JUX6_9PEZI|nr:hypothetical protein LTR36_006406 [Oleoguttula mirabilis]